MSLYQKRNCFKISKIRIGAIPQTTKMKNFFQTIFICGAIFGRKVIGDRSPVHYGILVLSALQIFNIMSLFWGVFPLIFNQVVELSFYFWIAVFLILMFINYRLYGSFKLVDLKTDRKGKWIAIIYIILSVLLLIFSMEYGRSINLSNS